ncbi:MAG: hypothetical protein H0V82_09710 [Candidatus Protochlamydia sp.]|nr:hypothetical protein [Candidatus Protochlamydia sp.]
MLPGSYLPIPDKKTSNTCTLSKKTVVKIEDRFLKSHLGFIYQSKCGEEFSKPSISTERLVSHFFSLGYSKIKRYRAVEDFEEMGNVCDIILLGIKKKFLFYPAWPWAKNEEKSPLLVEFKKLHDHFLRDEKAIELGYQNAKVKLISQFKDQEKGNLFIEQGFQICVILTYHKV